MLPRREAYDAVCVRQAMKGDIIEDLALAWKVKRAGFRLLLADGRALVSTRMYFSLSGIWQGWSKRHVLWRTRGQGRAWQLAVYVLYSLISVTPLVLSLRSAAGLRMTPYPGKGSKAWGLCPANPHYGSSASR
jgi:hypothetical protein